VKIFIVLFGLFVILMAGWMLLRPKDFAAVLLENSESKWMHVLASVVRLIFGIVLLLYASNSHFPLTLQIIGWIGIVAGISLALTPRKKFTRLIQWAFEKFSPYMQISALFAALFGGFLIYAVI